MQQINRDYILLIGAKILAFIQNGLAILDFILSASCSMSLFVSLDFQLNKLNGIHSLKRCKNFSPRSKQFGSFKYLFEQCCCFSIVSVLDLYLEFQCSKLKGITFV